MNYNIYIYNPTNHTHIVPAIAAATTIGNAISIAQVFAKTHDKDYCVVRGDIIVAWADSPSTVKAMQDAIGNALERVNKDSEPWYVDSEDTVDPYDGVPADTGSV